MTRRLMRWLLLFALSVLVVSSAITGCSRGTAKNAVSTQTVTVQRGNIAITVNSSGSVSYPNETILAFPVSGTLLELPVSLGDQVKQGQTIARIDDTTYKNAVLQAEANLSSAQIALKTAQTNGSETVLQAQKNVASSQQALTLAQSQLTLARMQAAANLAAAQETLLEAQAAVRAAQASLDAANLSKDQAQQSLSLAKVQAAQNLAAAQETQTATQAAVTAAQVALDQAKANAAQAQQNLLLAQNQATQNLTVAQETLTEAQAAVTAAQTAVSTTQTALDQAKASADQSQRSLASAQAQATQNNATAQAAVDQAAQTYRLQIRPYTFDADNPVDPRTFLEPSLSEIQLYPYMQAYYGLLNAISARDLTRLQGQNSAQTAQNAVTSANNAVTTANNSVTQAQETLRQAQAKVAQIQGASSGTDSTPGTLQITQLQGQNSVQTAQNALNSANNAVTQAQENLRQNQVKLVQIQGDPAQQDIKGQLEITRIQGQQSIQTTQNALTSANNAVTQAQENLRQSQAKLIQVQGDPMQRAIPGTLAITRLQADQSVASAGNSVDQAQETLRRVQAALAQQQTSAADDVALKSLQVSLAQSSLDQAKKNLEGTVLKAPFAGALSAITTTDVGNSVGSGTAIATLSDTSSVQVNATVDEVDVSQVQVGQTVAVTTDALPNVTLPGRVKSISPVGQVQSGVVSYPIVVEVTRLNGGQSGQTQMPGGTPPAGMPGGMPGGGQQGGQFGSGTGRPAAGSGTVGRQGQGGSGFTQRASGSGQPLEGMTALASIVVQQRTNVLVVPTRAVRTSGGKQYVNLASSTGTVQQEVTTGLSDGTNIEIVSGLNEGDQVLMQVSGPTPTPPARLRGMPGGGFMP